MNDLQSINTGAFAFDPAADDARAAFEKINENFAEVETAVDELSDTVFSLSAGEGGKTYDTLAAAQALDPKPANGTVFQVSKITDSANAGYYTFQSGSSGGTRFEKPFLEATDTIAEGSTDVAESGAVHAFAVAKESVAIRVTGKNLFNPDAARIGIRVLSDGTLGNITGEVTSADISAAAGEKFTLSGCSTTTKYVCFKDASDVTLSTTSSTAASFTITAPASCAYFYASVIRASVPVDIDTVMIEKSDAVTTFEPYEEAVESVLNDPLIASKLLIAGALTKTEDLVLRTYDLKVFIKADLTKWYVRIPFNLLYDLIHVWGFDPKNLIPEPIQVLKVLRTLEDSDAVFSLVVGQIQSPNDDITPVFLDQNRLLGGGHGLSTRLITATAHGKTASDHLSRWFDGRYHWRIIDIPDANTIRVMGEAYAFPNGSAVPDGFFTATLTHVSGAVNTGNITVGSSANSELSPVTKDRACVLTLDDKVIAAAGVHYGNVFKIIDTHRLVDDRTLVFQYPFVPNDGDDLLENVITYTYEKTNTLAVDYVTNFLATVFLNHYGFTQIQRPATSFEGATATMLYIPNTGPIMSGATEFNLATTPVSVTSSPFSATFFYTNANLPDPARCVNRSVEIQQVPAGSRKNIIAVTFSYDLGITKYDNRKLLATQWEVRNTAKLYPKGIDDFFAANDVIQARLYRTYTDAELNPDATCVYWYPENGSYYLFIDFHQTVDKQKVYVPDYFRGLKITEVETNGDFTLHTNDYVPMSGELLVSVDTYGYIALKLTN